MSVNTFGIPTPLGLLAIDFLVGGEALPVPADQERSSPVTGERLCAWRLPGETTVELRIVPLRTVPAVVTEMGERIRADSVWAVLLTVTTEGPCNGIEFRVSFGEGIRGDWYTGDELAARQYSRHDVELVVGGGDADFFERRIRAGLLPSTWADVMSADQGGTLYGETGRQFDTVGVLPVLGRGADGLGWLLPAWKRGQSVKIHAAVAWASGSLAASACWYAVDTTPEVVLRESTLDLT
jgi:hypothetical protein